KAVFLSQTAGLPQQPSSTMQFCSTEIPSFKSSRKSGRDSLNRKSSRCWSWFAVRAGKKGSHFGRFKGLPAFALSICGDAVKNSIEKFHIQKLNHISTPVLICLAKNSQANQGMEHEMIDLKPICTYCHSTFTPSLFH